MPTENTMTNENKNRSNEACGFTNSSTSFQHSANQFSIFCVVCIKWTRVCHSACKPTDSKLSIFFCNQIYGSGCFFRPWTKFILVVSRRAPHPDYMKGDGLETGREIVQVRDSFSNLTSVVVGDAGWRTQPYLDNVVPMCKMCKLLQLTGLDTFWRPAPFENVATPPAKAARDLFRMTRIVGLLPYHCVWGGGFKFQKTPASYRLIDVEFPWGQGAWSGCDFFWWTAPWHSDCVEDFVAGWLLLLIPCAACAKQRTQGPTKLPRCGKTNMFHGCAFKNWRLELYPSTFANH